MHDLEHRAPPSAHANLKNVLNIGKDFSLDPGGRFNSDGDGNGEEFREEHLKMRLGGLKEGEKLTVILDDGVESYGSSFLSEGFAGMVKYGYMEKNELLGKLEFKFENPDFDFYRQKIVEYINESVFDSAVYKRTEKLISKD